MAFEAFVVPVLAPPFVRKGDSVRVLIGFVPATGVTPEAFIIDPSGRQLPVQIKVKTEVAGKTNLAAYYFDYAFTINGTYSIYVYVSVDPTPDIYTGIASVHVPAWLDNIDQRISTVEDIRVEMQQLRTTVVRNR